jgi:4-amino-4-deoxy-L-arabinose transferase-like glycosyltransferase
MWVITAGMLLYYPEYRGLGQGYMDYEKESLDAFMTAQGRDSRALLQVSRLIQVLIITGLLLVCFFLLRKLAGTPLAVSGILLASFDPFYLGQSRLLNHEAMFVGFIAISLFSLVVYLTQGRKLIYLLVSAVSGGLAQLTKSSGIALLVPVGLLLVMDIFQNRGRLRTAILEAVKTLGLWSAVLALTYVLFWPGMWVAPAKMLHEVYGNAFSFAFRGARLIALEDAPSTPSNLNIGVAGIGAQLTTILWHTPVPTWVGVLLGVLLLLTRAREQIPLPARIIGWLAGLTGLVFVLMFGVAQGRDSPHYVLTSYWMFSLLAALGWFMAFRWLSERMRTSRVEMLGMAALVLLQAGTALAYYPYYFTYQNPLLARLQPPRGPLWAYGEGLETAALYLSGLPDARNSVALAYYGRGCFSFFFDGQTTRFKPYYVEPGHEQDLKEALEGADYLVLYPAVQGLLPKYAHLFEALSSVKPVKEISLNGYRYALIYRVDSFSADVREKLFTHAAQP